MIFVILVYSDYTLGMVDRICHQIREAQFENHYTRPQ